jgi:membrane-associated protease RseP (regulator of RpoE activity)
VAVVDIYSGSPAARLGLRAGDIIRSINGNSIRTVGDLTAILEAGRGLAWRLEVERNGMLLRQFVRLNRYRRIAKSCMPLRAALCLKRYSLLIEQLNERPFLSSGRPERGPQPAAC